MDKDIKMWVKQCISCQKSKINIHTKSPNVEIAIPQCRFEHIHMDIVGPLPVSKGYKYLLTIIDRTTRWPEAYPLRDITSETIVKTFIHNYISRFGIPLKITVDRGTQFTSFLFSKLSETLGIQKIHTSAYHPQSNGMIERFHRQLKASIIASNDPLHWSDQLPIILLGLRNSIKEDLKCSPAEMVYGQTLRIPGQLVVPIENCDNIEHNFILKKLREHFSQIHNYISHHGELCFYKSTTKIWIVSSV